MEEPRISAAINLIMDSWEDWHAEAMQAAQVQQNPLAFEVALGDQLRDVLVKLVNDTAEQAAQCCEGRAKHHQMVAIRCEAEKCAGQIRHRFGI